MNSTSIAISQSMTALCIVTQDLPLGTNLALLHFLWMQISGALLPSRGALFPALQAIGLTPAEVRRAWSAFRYGAWEISDPLSVWASYVTQPGQWQEHTYEGYRPKAIDLTAYWRPTLRGLKSQHYYPPAGKARPAVVMGLACRVGSINGQRVALITDLVRADVGTASETALRTDLLRRVAQTLAPDEMPVLDAGFKIRELQAAKLSRYTVRLAVNFTARRNRLPPSEGGRPPEYGERVRPLARVRNGKTIAATSPDRVETWMEEGLPFRAEFWDNLVLPDVKVRPDNPTFCIVALYDPRFRHPWLLACPLRLTGASLRGLYRDRWPVEQIPVAGKQMLGGARQFVFAPESCQRLPELTLFAGSLVTYLATTLPAVPTGFWDRCPKPTPGRLRRVLAQAPFPKSYPLPSQLRKRKVACDHLPKGILGHRREKHGALAQAYGQASISRPTMPFPSRSNGFGKFQLGR
jgi:hypothetical protein